MNDTDHAREDARLLDGSYRIERITSDGADLADGSHLTTNPANLAAGGWCAPSEVAYDPLLDHPMLYGPFVTVPRGGITFTMPPDPDSPEGIAQAARWEADRAHAEFVRRHVATHVGDIEMAKHDTIHAAVYWARTQALPWSVHLHRASWSRFVGITVWPERSGVSTLRTHDLESDDSWGGSTFTADDWCEMFEELD